MNTTLKPRTTTTTKPSDEVAPVRWVIFDIGPPIDGGQTYLYGLTICARCGQQHKDLWGPDRSHAMRFQTYEDARDAIAEIDPEEWLRDRLFPFPASERT